MPGAMNVIVHAGGSSSDAVEPVIVPCKTRKTEGAIWTVQLLETPDGVPGLAEGDTVRCLKRAALRYPLLVTEQYLHERRHSYVTPCDECGFPEAFDPPTVLAAALPDPPGTTGTFTTQCPLCEGTQMVRLLPPEPATPRDAPAEEIARAVRGVVAEHFDEPADAIDPTQPLQTYGGDELDALQITFALEAHFVVCLPDDSIDGLLSETLDQLTARIRATLADFREGALLDLDD